MQSEVIKESFIFVLFCFQFRDNGWKIHPVLWVFYNFSVLLFETWLSCWHFCYLWAGPSQVSSFLNSLLSTVSYLLWIVGKKNSPKCKQFYVKLPLGNKIFRKDKKQLHSLTGGLDNSYFRCLASFLMFDSITKKQSLWKASHWISGLTLDIDLFRGNIQYELVPWHFRHAVASNKKKDRT